MLTEKVYFDKENDISLTTYILDSSKELTNMQTRPAVLIFPGGGYRFCSDREAEPVAMAYLAQGFNAFVLRYSINERSPFPNPLNDGERALAYIKENCEKFHTDPDKIAVVGFSAGGHLAAAMATMAKERPAAAILGYPCILDSIGDVLYSPVPSLEKEVDEKTSPCFIFATCPDDCVPVENSLEFALALTKNKIPYELHIFPDGGHGMSLATFATSNGNPGGVNPTVAQWMAMSVRWLNGLFDVKA